MKRETQKAVADMFIGMGMMLTVAWIVGFWLNDPHPTWATFARGLTIPFMVVGIVLSAERKKEG